MNHTFYRLKGTRYDNNKTKRCGMGKKKDNRALRAIQLSHRNDALCHANN